MFSTLVRLFCWYSPAQCERLQCCRTSVLQFLVEQLWCTAHFLYEGCVVGGGRERKRVVEKDVNTHSFLCSTSDPACPPAHCLTGNPLYRERALGSQVPWKQGFHPWATCAADLHSRYHILKIQIISWLSTCPVSYDGMLSFKHPY